MEALQVLVEAVAGGGAGRCRGSCNGRLYLGVR